jgi:hypothetical protein
LSDNRHEHGDGRRAVDVCQAHCETVVELTTKFNLLTEALTRDAVDRKEWREFVDEKLAGIERSIYELRIPYKIGFFIMLGTISAAIIATVTKSVEWCWTHIH